MEIEIFPKRLLLANTSEDLLNSILETGMVRNIIVQGPKLSKSIIVPSREYATGLKVDIGHENLRNIKFGEREIELKVQVGRIIIEPKRNIDLNYFLEILQGFCKNLLPFGFDIKVKNKNLFKIE